jgi:hypothetical protein
MDIKENCKKKYWSCAVSKSVIGRLGFFTVQYFCCAPTLKENYNPDDGGSTNL